MSKSTRRNSTDRLFKVIVIGDPEVGKTSFVQRYTSDSFKRDYQGTVGVDFALKIFNLSEHETIKVQLWDIAGQERFKFMTRVYYRDAHGAVILFDLNNKNSFISALKWKKDVDAKCQTPDGKPIPTLLLANKCDLNKRQVDQTEIEQVQRDNNFIAWTEVSAKDGLMVEDSMRFLAETMMKSFGSERHVAPLEKTIQLTPYAQTQKSSCSC